MKRKYLKEKAKVPTAVIQSKHKRNQKEKYALSAFLYKGTNKINIAK